MENKSYRRRRFGNQTRIHAPARGPVAPIAPQYGPWPLPSIERARSLARSYFAGNAEQQEQLAQYIAQTGDAVFHAVSVVFKTSCFCAVCRPDIKVFC